MRIMEEVMTKMTGRDNDEGDGEEGGEGVIARITEEMEAF